MLDLGILTLIRWNALQISDSIIESARTSGTDPIAWVTGNSYMPPLRSFSLAEQIWQLGYDEDEDAFGYLVELVERQVDDAGVALECPDYDNALYAVDLRRFEYVESTDGENLQDDWRLILCGTVGCKRPATHVITYSFPESRNHAETDRVCQECGEGYVRRPSLRAAMTPIGE